MSTSPRRIGKYEMQSVLGRGGMAEVWKAVDTQLGRTVAIKFLHADLQNDPNFLTRFEREARVIAALNHPNILKIYDFHISRPPESSTTTCYMVMDYIPGQTLAAYIRQTSRMGKFPSMHDILHLFFGIGMAVDYAHQRGVIHRDIKPGNILLDTRAGKSSSPVLHTIGEPILADFGIVKLLGATSNTVSGGWFGTPLYVSPEQVKGVPGNEQSDVYAIAVILYEIMTGRVPFQGESTHAIMMQHINAVPMPPNMLNPQISPLVSAVLLRGLAKNPADRFLNATALAEALSDATQISVPLEREAGKWEKQAESVHYTGTEPRQSVPVSPQIPSPVLFAPPSSSSLHASFHTTPGVSTSNQGESDATVLRTGTTPHLQSMSLSLPQPAFVPPVAPPIAINGSGRRKRGGYIVLVLSLLVVLIGGGLGLFFVLNAKTAGYATTNQVVGHAFFISSGQIKESSSQGITDELQIDLTPISDPPSGKSYYGWLLPDKGMNMTAPLLLGNLVVTNGQIHSFYPGDPQHDNLLETMSRFLITTEEASLTPVIPSPDTHTWYYTSEFPQSSNQVQTPTPMLSSSPASVMSGMSDLSVLAHLRHLLAEAPELKAVGLEGGLDIWLFRNTQKVLESAGTARDDWQTKATPLLHRHLIRILDYLDGVSFVHADAPGQPILVPPETASIGLLDADPARLSAGLLHEIDIHLNAMIQSPGFTAGQRALAIRIDAGIKNAIFWLEKVRQDTQQLVNRTNDQLGADPVLSDLDSIASEALNAFVGRIDPATGNVQEGVIQVHFNDQRLATFDVKPYQA